MAPGRRRGAKGAKSKSQLNLGDLVLAKVKGHPAWPAKIAKPEDWNKTPDPKKCFVNFFGTNEIAFVAPADIQEFTVESKNKLVARCGGKTVKFFAAAVKEICAAFKELQEKSSSGLEADTDKSDFGSEAPSVHGVVDDAKFTGLEVTNVVDELHGDTVQRVPDDHDPGSDRSLQRQNEVHCQDVKSSIIGDANKHSISEDGLNYPKEVKPSASIPGNLSCPKEEPFCDKTREDTVVHSKPSRVTARTGGFNASKDGSPPEAAGQALDGVENDSSSLVPLSVLAKYLDDRHKKTINGHKSQETNSGSRRRLNGDAQAQKNSSSGSIHGDYTDIPKSGEDALRKRSGSSGGLKDLSPEKSRSNLDTVGGRAQKQSLKDKVHLARAGLLDKKGTIKKHDTGDPTGRKMNSQLGHGKHKLDTDEVSLPVKRSKSDDVALELTKGSIQRNKKIGHLDNKASSMVSRSVLQGDAENCSAPRNEEASPPSKRRRQVQDVADGSSTKTSDKKTGKGPGLRNDNLSSDNLKSPGSQFPKKRRAVRLYDDYDDEPKTPVHGGSIKKVDNAPSRVLDSVKSVSVQNRRTSGILNDDSSEVSLSTVKVLNQTSSPNSHKHVEVERPRQTLTTHVFTSPVKAESSKRYGQETEPDKLSPPRSPSLASALKPVVESLKGNRPVVKVSDNISQRKSQVGSDKNKVAVPDGLACSANIGIHERNRSIPSVERKKDTPKSSSRMSDSVALVGKNLDILSSAGDSKLEKDKDAGREDKMNVLSDTKNEDSILSMRHLIAVAQAKRREAHSQSFSHGNSYNDVSGGSPSFGFAVPPIQSGSNNMNQADMQGYYAQSSLVSPSHIPQMSSDNHPEIEELEDQRFSSGHPSAGDLLSGGTEAAVARDAFEGMIETLSRTKESIGRATRLAIDCAKYGIASEVVELLIHKLETESSLHRRVDLFFLVDSITQCSHSQKGIAGASYIPTVQAALPRLLGAAAPPEAAARENRRQCLKVLRLWLERKILPESLLRRFMDDIGVSNDEPSAGSFLRRPSRAERAVDDPIREMEGMLVDEYGSNVTFQLPGFVTSHVFDEEEEEEPEIPKNSCDGNADDESPVEPTSTAEEAEKFTVTPNDRRHCILEDVDGELEMEDVSVHQKDEREIFTGAPFEIASNEQCSDMILETTSNSYAQLPFPMGSPPSPLGSPPATPPLPSSPPPVSLPPPPPVSPSPPPPPPPPPPLPPQEQPHAAPPAGIPPSAAPPQSSVIPQPSILPQHLHPFQSSLPSSSPKLPYQLQVPHDHCGTPSGTQLTQLAGNNPHGAHIDVNIRNEMFSQPSSSYVSGYNSARPFDCGHTDTYTNPQIPQPSQQFQPVPLPQRAFRPAPPPQAPSSHFSYSNPAVQQRPHHPYPQPYMLPTHPDGQRQYHTDDMWKTQSNEFSTNNPLGSWINGVRSSMVPVPSFAHEGYYRPPLERPPAITANFQQPALNTIPAGPPNPGNNGPQMMPCRPDMSSLSSRRPA